tara:strand:- start:28 stop:342 length:315 start_codon:yes stop_codon:yes gene_type:complete
MKELRKVNDDNFFITSQTMRWVERDKDGKVIGTHKDNPKVGYTLAMDPYENQFQTKPIIKIFESTDKVIHFKTEDEEYKLYLEKYFEEIFERLDKKGIITLDYR